MNLHAIVTPLISTVNPPTPGTVRVSTGYTTADDGSQVPTYAPPAPVTMQVQALSTKELAHTDSLNLQGTLRAVYVNGAFEGENRRAGKGGDLFTFAGNDWLVVTVLEPWDNDGWCKLVVQLQ